MLLLKKIRGEKRNLGADKAIGDYLVFIDDDTTLQENILTMLKNFKKQKSFGGFWFNTQR